LDEQHNDVNVVSADPLAKHDKKGKAGKSLQVAINHCGLLCSIDGVIGNKTINAANAIEPRVLFDALTNERERFFYAIGVGKNAKFINGWINRLNDYRKTFRP
jgi:lysozyme family protein